MLLDPLCRQEQRVAGASVEGFKVGSGLAADILGNQPVEVATAQVVIPGDGRNGDDIFEAVHHGHVQGPAPKVEDHEGLEFICLMTGNGRRRRLINKTFYLETQQLARLLSGLALLGVEVSRHTNDQLGHLLA